MAGLIPDEKCLILLIKKYVWLVQYAAGYHPGPVAPPRADGASLPRLKNSKNKNFSRMCYAYKRPML